MGAMGHAAPTPLVFPDAEGPVVPEGTHPPWHPGLLGEEGGVSGGVVDHGTDAEDGPVPWEALASPRPIPVERRAGAPSPTHGTWRAHVSSARRGTDQAPASREAIGQGHQSPGRRRQGVGGRQRSGDVGERRGSRTRPSQGGPW
jgi:hypothetical protein